MELNTAQQEAVNVLSGPLLVLAGAGTGKTRVVTCRIARLIRARVRPDRILAVTFTNKAADEMQQRAMELIGRRVSSRPEISTFHSLCVRILRRHARRLGYPTKFAIYDRGDQESVARTALREIKVPEAALRPRDLLYLIERWKTSALSPQQAASRASSEREHLAAAAYRRYQQALRTAGAMDFDDLLMLTEQLFEQFAEVRKKEAARFDHLLIDEYQDTNPIQYRIVRTMAAEHRNLCVVGDDDQSIYAFRGAEVGHILRFQRDWPDARVIRLETNYRSTREILTWANRLIRFNRSRYDKTLRATCRGEPPRVEQLRDEQAEAEAVVAEIAMRLRGHRRAPRDFAILCRTNEQPRLFEEELRRVGVPYVLLGSMSFYDRREIRDLLAYFKLLAKPDDDVALLRVINTPPRGLGQTTVRRLTEEALQEGKPLWELVSKAKRRDDLSGPARTGAQELSRLVRELQEKMRSEPLGEVIHQLVQRIGYRAEIDRLYDDPAERQTRWAAVENLVNAVSEYAQRAGKPTLAGFLQEVALAGQEDSRDRDRRTDRNAVSLMTLHAAKGLEFREVYLVGMEEGLLPHKRAAEEGDRAVEEERRLCYVGVTRAQRRLTLTMALSRRKWGKPRPTTPSRFLYELTGQAEHPNYEVAVHALSGPHKPRAGRSTKTSHARGTCGAESSAPGSAQPDTTPGGGPSGLRKTSRRKAANSRKPGK